MDINNFRCSICLEIFSKKYVPCTLQCGHSLCINHIMIIKSCPVCNQKIYNSKEIKPNCIFRDFPEEFIRMNKHIYDKEFNELIEQEKKEDSTYNIKSNTKSKHESESDSESDSESKQKPIKKKPLTGYILFASENRDDILKEHPGLRVTEVAVKLGERWRKLTDAQKERYQPKN